MNDIFEERKAKVETYKKIRGKQEKLFKVDIPEGLFVKCDCCNEYLFREDLSGSHYVCHKCRFHFRVSARERLKMVCDEFVEMFSDLKTLNPLDFPGYEKKIKQYQEQTGEIDAFVCGTGVICGEPVAIGVMDSFFMMGSMGSVVGEKVTRLIEHATRERLPLVIFFRFGRRPNAGRNFLADANGQDRGRLPASRRGGPASYRRFDQPDDRRRRR